MDIYGVPGFGKWQSKKSSGAWEDFPSTLVADIDRAHMTTKHDYTFTLRHQNAGLREGDPCELHYKIDFHSMTQICVEHPERKRSVRQVDCKDVILTPILQTAILNAEKQAYEDCGDKLLALKKRMERLGGSSGAFDQLWQWMAHEAPIIIQVKLGRKGGPGAEDMVDVFMKDVGKRYRNMFELASGAGRGCTDTGSRSSWERRMYGDTYHREVEPGDRPKYGCLNMTNDPQGVPLATQYGSSYLVLKNSLRWRCTFTSRDSARDSSTLATTRQFAKFLADGAEGASDVELQKIWLHDGQTIDEYREVQIHGPVRFDYDVEKLVVDNDLPESVKSKCRRWGQRDGFAVEFLPVHATRKGDSKDGGNM